MDKSFKEVLELLEQEVVKRGRGRPKGSKSGARVPGTPTKFKDKHDKKHGSGDYDDLAGGYGEYALHLPDTFRTYREWVELYNSVDKLL